MPVAVNVFNQLGWRVIPAKEERGLADHVDGERERLRSSHGNP